VSEDEIRSIGGRILAPGEGRAVVVPSAGGRVTMKAESGDTGGAGTVFENVLPPQAPGPARHFHRTWTGLFHVLEGELLFEVDGQKRGDPCRSAGVSSYSVLPGTYRAIRRTSPLPANVP
jgi:hypothetical protein